MVKQRNQKKIPESSSYSNNTNGFQNPAPTAVGQTASSSTPRAAPNQAPRAKRDREKSISQNGGAPSYRKNEPMKPKAMPNSKKEMKPSQKNGKNASKEKLNEEFKPVEPVTIEKNNKHLMDTVLAYLEHTEWDKVELVCELVTLLSPIDLRLVGNCVEGLARTHSLQLKPLEKRANADNPICSFPPSDVFLSNGGIYPSFETTPSSSDGYHSNASPRDQATQTNAIVSTPKSPRTVTMALSNRLPAGMAKSVEEEEIVVKEEEPMEKPMSIFESVLKVLDGLYSFVALLSSMNRKSAHQIYLYIDSTILAGKERLLMLVPSSAERLKIVEKIGKVVSSCIHHPAFSISERIRLVAVRDELRSDCERYFNEMVNEQKRSDDEDLESENEKDAAGTSKKKTYAMENEQKSSFGLVYIQRIMGSQVDETDKQSFLIELHWSDGERTFTHRTREQLRVLQHRLLDEFGQQRIDGGSVEEDQKGSRRILPHLLPEATTAEVVQYINELSDLPARMMLSRVMCEEFYATRIKIGDESNDDNEGIVMGRSARNVKMAAAAASTAVPAPKMPTPHFNAAAHTYSIPIYPFLYGPAPVNHLQIVEASCSTCGGDHLFNYCDKQSILERKTDFKLNYQPSENEYYNGHFVHPHQPIFAPTMNAYYLYGVQTGLHPGPQQTTQAHATHSSSNSNNSHQ